MAERETEAQRTSGTPRGPVLPGGPDGPWGSGRPRRPGRWFPWAAAALLSVAVGILAYSAGVSQGAGAQAAGDGVRHWHAGFPFFALFGLFWLMFIVRALYWGACWGWGPRYYRRYDAWYDDPARWDEWHRRAHEHNPPRS